MGVARVYRSMGLKQRDRLPVATYDEAVRRLVCHRIDERLDDFAFYHLVEMVSDIFWTSDKRVVRDVRVAAKEMGCSEWTH